MNFPNLRDPRYFQIATLLTLLTYGVTALGFEFRPEIALTIAPVALATQYVATRLWRLPRFDPLSALITGLSLTLLLRVASVEFAVAAAVIAIVSKFLLRIRGKHVFNPANFALVTMMLMSDQVWVSSGQWGSSALLAVLLGSAGAIVLNKARRAETSLAFLGAFAFLVFGRAWFLGDPLAIPMHQLQNGALLVFAFFMISDPRTTPDSAPGRIVYGSVVAAVGFAIQYFLFIPAGPVWALACCAPLVPLFDRFLTGRQYHWRAENRLALPRRQPSSSQQEKDLSHA